MAVYYSQGVHQVKRSEMESVSKQLMNPGVLNYYN